MFKKGTFAVILCFIILLTGCGGPSTKKAEQTNNNTGANTSTNDNKSQTDTTNQENPPKNEAKASVTVPDGWHAVEGSAIPVHYMKNTASFMMKKEAIYGNTLDDVVKAAKDAFEKAFSNVQYAGSVENISVNGKDARKFVFTCEVSKIQMKFMYVYMFVGKDIYAITFGDMKDSFDSLSKDYQTILNNIKFQ